MTTTHLANVTVHIDEDLDHPQRDQMEDGFRALDGVVSVHMAQGPAAHLVVVGYDPEQSNSQDLLSAVSGQGHHGALIGF